MKTVDVIIPAYNEEENIAHILFDVQSQKENNFEIKNIYIISDASTDQTESIVQKESLKDPRIRLIRKPSRKGQVDSLNQGFSLSSAEQIVLLDADTRIIDTDAISILVNRMILEKADLGAALVERLPPRNLYESLFFGIDDIVTEIKKGDIHTDYSYYFNGKILTCSKKLKSLIHFPSNVIDGDTFIFLKTKELHLPSIFVPESKIYYRLATGIADYVNQQRRWRTRTSVIYFEDSLCKKYIHKTSLFVLFKKCIKYMLFHPFRFIAFLLLEIYLRLSLWIKPDERNPKWIIPSSTKKLY